MAAVEQISVRDLGPGLEGLGGVVIDEVKDRVLQEVKKAGWRWYYANVDRVLFSYWIFKLKVSKLKFLFEELFGPEPAN